MTTATEAPQALVAADALQVIYQRGATPAVDGVTFTLQPGDGLLIAGDPGSGKSTVLRALVGLVRFGGELSVLGGYPGTAAVTPQVGWGPQGKAFASGQSPASLVAMVARLRGAAVDTLDATVADALGAAGIAGADARRSTTDVEVLRRTSLACAAVGDPTLVVLDDPWEFSETIDVVNAARARGGAVIAASHDPGGLSGLLGTTITLVEGVPA